MEFKSVDTRYKCMGMNELSNWEARGLCSWSVNECICNESLDDLARITRGEIKKGSSCEISTIG